MLGGVNNVSSQIASIYNSGNQQLASTLEKLASGKKFQNASEDLLGFIRAQNIGLDISGYQKVKENLTSFKAYSSAAVQAGSSIYENLKQMKDLASQYTNTTDADQKAEYKSDFDALKKQVTSAIDNTFVDGTKVTSSGAAIQAVDLDPDGKGKLTMNFSDIADGTEVGNLDITAAGAAAGVQTQIDSMLTYLSEAKSYDSIASQQMNLTDTIIASKQSVQSMITDVDEAQAMNDMIDQSIRQQAAVSMMAQANMSREAILKLYS